MWTNFQIFKNVKDHLCSVLAQVLRQQPVMFLDAIGRITPIDLEWINSFEVRRHLSLG